MKYILLGSAPYAPLHWLARRSRYDDYKIAAINNAWAYAQPLDEWFIPDDFLQASPKTGIHSGRLIPPPHVLQRLPVSPMPPRVIGYRRAVGGTMAINVMHILLNRAIATGDALTLVVIGCDMVYQPGQRSHFYGGSAANPAVQAGLLKHRPELVGINADPLRFGDEWLDDELEHVRHRYNEAGCMIMVDTPLDETRLPFERAE